MNNKILVLLVLPLVLAACHSRPYKMPYKCKNGGWSCLRQIGKQTKFVYATDEDIEEAKKQESAPAPVLTADTAEDAGQDAAAQTPMITEDFAASTEDEKIKIISTPSSSIIIVQDTKEPQKPAPTKAPAKESPSYIVDGRHLHPFLKTPYIEGEQAKYPAPYSNEEMEFSVYFSFMKVGTAYIKTKGIVDTPIGKAYVVETTAESASVIDAVFRVRDYNYSMISVKDYSSLGYSQSIREGKYVRDEWLTFNPAKKTFEGLVRRRDGEDREIKGEIPGPVQDMLSSLYYVRTQNFDAKTPIEFDVTNREKTYPLKLTVLKKEKVKTKAGTFNCIVVEPQFRGEGIFIQKGSSLKVWLTDDERKIPVKMETKVFIGSVSAELVKYKKS
ncbi:Protein of unknown function (DUF3108) [Parelusimicrobium proximum]|uniref:DUF3108 domain-containing protein n=1 Tax=Parelusimicrobium proximum TaxID=3228953 RepID=UPI003D17CDD8